jgi:hypothetical protein
LVAIALRNPSDIKARRGVATITRGDAAPQSGQAAGSLRCAIARIASKSPQLAQA